MFSEAYKRSGRHPFILLFVLSCLHAQSATPSAPPIDIYTNFLGVWSGTDVRPGHPTEPVQVTITESKHHDAIRMDYIYGHKGDKDYDRATKFISLDTKKSQITIWFKGEAKDRFTSPDLNQFAATGLGTFTAAATNETTGDLDRCTFTLGKDGFMYRWDFSDDGDEYDLRSIFTFNRVSKPELSR